MRRHAAVGRSGTWLAAVAVLACGGGEDIERPSPSALSDVVVLTEAWETPRDTLDNIDSPAVWHGPGGEHWLIATAKETDALVVSDASTGGMVRRVGSEGTAPGEMDRPNGIAVVDDYLFLVERDNARVQVFSLPDFRSLGVYGTGDLIKPYGITIVPAGADLYATWITDNHEFVEDVVPPDSLLGERVRHYRVQMRDGSLDATLVNTFGDTEGDGVLRVVESLSADPAYDRLLVAEEQEGASMIKVYTLGGMFRGEVIPERFFPNQAEGIVLYECGTGGYWITTDQGEEVNTFHVFDREHLGHLGSFRGRTVMNTDGVALTRTPFPGFPSGAFFAVHDDGNVAAFHWSDIASALGLRADCLSES